jgi:hypothetical protein
MAKATKPITSKIKRTSIPAILETPQLDYCPNALKSKGKANTPSRNILSYRRAVPINPGKEKFRSKSNNILKTSKKINAAIAFPQVSP